MRRAVRPGSADAVLRVGIGEQEIRGLFGEKPAGGWAGDVPNSVLIRSCEQRRKAPLGTGGFGDGDELAPPLPFTVLIL